MAKTRVGKHVLETLTLGMYEDPRAIYREYVQNSVDQIDNAQEQGIFENENKKGRVHIKIDKERKTIEIYDNATGIISEKAPEVLRHIAESEKDSKKARGFRGIGRLGGLGYCEELIFETSFRGEDKKSIIKWNAFELKKLLHDKTEKREAGELIDAITSYTIEGESHDKHYFKVKMKNVTNKALLVTVDIIKYLEMIAPVPYSQSFLFKTKINEFLKSNKISSVSEYPIYINEEEIFKPYLASIYEPSGSSKKRVGEVYDIVPFRLLNPRDELLAWGWYGINNFADKKIKGIHAINQSRGLRLRKGNIQIGNEKCLAKLHKEERFNLYFFGEIHAKHDELIPNARRDYFEDSEALGDFEEKVRKCFEQGPDRLVRFQSDLASEVKKIENYENLRKEYNDPNKMYTTKKDKEDLEEKVKEAETSENAARKKLDKLKKGAGDDNSLLTVYKTITKPLETQSEVPLLVINDSKKIPFETDSLYSLNKKERKLISRIFEIINDVLPKDLADNLREKIKEKLND